MSKKNQNYTNRKQNRFQPERMRGNVFVNNSGKQWLPRENGRAAKVERLLRGAKEEKKEIAGNMAGYKNSGIEWIGAIPEGWNVSKVKHETSFIGSGTTPRSGCLSFYENGTIPWIQSGDLYETSEVTDTKQKITAEALRSSSALKVYDKDFIAMAMYGSIGNIAISRIAACVNQACCCLKPNSRNNLNYMYYFLKTSTDNFKSKAMGAVLQNISQEKIKNQDFLVPPLHEQQRIADFLDTKCGILDRTIDAVSRQIEDLEKYKKALITKTVTKGICKKGEPERAMKDSGVEWIGGVPEEWSVSKVKYNFSTFKKIPGKESEKYERLSLTMNGVKHREKWTAEGLQPKDFMSYQLLRKGDLVFRLIDLQNPSKSLRVALSHDTGLISPAYTILHADNNKMLPEYAEMFFLMMSYLDVFNALGSCGVRSSINNAELMKISVLVPPLAEQQQIADYLDEKCKNIDNRMQKRRQQLEWLKEYKKSLIFDYVTGKKRVEE